MTKPSTTPFSLTYGEETKLPLPVKAATFHITAVGDQQLALVEARLTVCNDAVHKDIEAVLRFPLPDSDATVCGCSVGTDRAISVPKAKAAEVAYKEREKGRAVATAASVSAATWETAIYPLPYNVPVQVTIQVVCGLSEDGAVALPLTFAAPVERIDVNAVAVDGAAAGTDNLGGGVTNSTMPEGLRVTFAPAAAAGRVVSAMRDGSLFWSGRVPKEAIDRAFAEQPHQATEERQAAVPAAGNDVVHVGVVVDVSRSCAHMAEARLACLDTLAASYASTGRRAVFTLWGLSRQVKSLGEPRMDTPAALVALASVRYDGGTDLSLLTGLLSAAGPEGAGCEAVVLLSDGVSNLLAKQLPDLSDASAPPLHIPLPPPGAEANLALLRWLAYQTGGAAATPLTNPQAFADAVVGVTAQTLIVRLSTDLKDVEAWTDDALQTVPDFRLAALRMPAAADGSFHLSGVCDPRGRATPTALTLRIQRAGAVATLTLPIPPPDATIAGAAAAAATTTAEVAALTGGADASHRSLGRLLQVQHTLLCLRQVQLEQWDPKVAKTLATELACACGIASEHSSLLKLSLAEQFAEHGLACPVEHKAHAQWKELLAAREQEKAQRDAAAAERTERKLQNVVAPLVGRYQAMVGAKPAQWGKPVATANVGCGSARCCRGGGGCGGSAGGVGGGLRLLAASAGGDSEGRVIDEMMDEAGGDFGADLALTACAAAPRSMSTPRLFMPTPRADAAPLRRRAAAFAAEEAEEEGRAVAFAAEEAEEEDDRSEDDDHVEMAVEMDLLGAAGGASGDEPGYRAPPPANLFEDARDADDIPVYRGPQPQMPASAPAPRVAAVAADLEMMLSEQSAMLDNSAVFLKRARSPPALPSLSTTVGALGDALSGLAASASRLMPQLARRNSRGNETGLPASAAPMAAATAAGPAPSPFKPSPKQVTREPWLQTIADAYAASGMDGALAALDIYLAASGPEARERPSTFILASETLRELGANSAACADVLFNVLETKLPETQVCRVVAYHLLSFGRFDDAVALLELVRETLAPGEPHSFTDLAFARFHRLRADGAAAPDRTRTEMGKVVADLTHVLLSEWARRFSEIEWPVLMLLSWAVAWAEIQLASAAAPGEPSTSLWPEEQLPAAKYRLGGAAGPQLDVFVWLGWDTDHTDVDLHVKEPTGEEVYYSHNRSATTGAHVSRDFTDGFGPEVYTLPSAPKGTYSVETNYFASHQHSSRTGSTSAVVWSIKNMGKWEAEQVQFSSVRLTGHKQRQKVLSIEC